MYLELNKYLFFFFYNNTGSIVKELSWNQIVLITFLVSMILLL